MQNKKHLWLLALGQVILAWLLLESTTLMGTFHQGRTVDMESQTCTEPPLCLLLYNLG